MNVLRGHQYHPVTFEMRGNRDERYDVQTGIRHVRKFMLKVFFAGVNLSPGNLGGSQPGKKRSRGGWRVREGRVRGGALTDLSLLSLHIHDRAAVLPIEGQLTT